MRQPKPLQHHPSLPANRPLVTRQPAAAAPRQLLRSVALTCPPPDRLHPPQQRADRARPRAPARRQWSPPPRRRPRTCASRSAVVPLQPPARRPGSDKKPWTVTRRVPSSLDGDKLRRIPHSCRKPLGLSRSSIVDVHVPGTVLRRASQQLVGFSGLDAGRGSRGGAAGQPLPGPAGHAHRSEPRARRAQLRRPSASVLEGQGAWPPAPAMPRVVDPAVQGCALVRSGGPTECSVARASALSPGNDRGRRRTAVRRGGTAGPGRSG